MSRWRIGDRVEDLDGSAATVVQQISGGFVGIRYDDPQEAINIYGQPYEHHEVCIGESLLLPLGQGTLFDGPDR